MAGRWGYHVRTSKRRLAGIREHKFLGQFLYTTHRGRSEKDPNRYLILFPGEEPPGREAAQGGDNSAGPSRGDNSAGPSSAEEGTTALAPMESSSHNPSDNLFAREARGKKSELKPEEEKETAAEPPKNTYGYVTDGATGAMLPAGSG